VPQEEAVFKWKIGSNATPFSVTTDFYDSCYSSKSVRFICKIVQC